MKHQKEEHLQAINKTLWLKYSIPVAYKEKKKKQLLRPKHDKVQGLGQTKPRTHLPDFQPCILSTTQYYLFFQQCLNQTIIKTTCIYLRHWTDKSNVNIPISLSNDPIRTRGEATIQLAQYQTFLGNIRSKRIHIFSHPHALCFSKNTKPQLKPNHVFSSQTPKPNLDVAPHRLYPQNSMFVFIFQGVRCSVPCIVQSI